MGEARRPSAAELIAGRYRLGRRLGVGSRGEVFAARDEVGGAEVALKLLHPVDADERRRVLREVAALRALRVPGVVELLDEGRLGARHFIAMARVDGAPFPGPLPAGASEAATAAVLERVGRLLDVLDRVHAAGIVHRDLKPANVLVDAEGRVVVLDFGLARGSALGATLTASGAAVGTPRYQAPEQMRGLLADARADLYAVGVMAFEALAGRAPHPLDTLPLLMRARLTAPAPSLAEVAPGVPPAAAALVDRLLAREPADRPPTASAARAALRGRTATAVWPWLGDHAPIDAIVARIDAGERCAVGGPRRSGRSRAVHEAALRLARERPVARLLPGDRPYASLAGVLDPSALVGPSPMPERVHAALAALLATGHALVADEAIDRWTARALDGLTGRVVRVVPPGAPADVTLGPVPAEALRPLFTGPDRLFHLAEDAAAALVQQAGGLRGDLAETLAAWTRDGVVQRVGPRFAVDRAALRQAVTRPRGAAGGVDAVEGALADVVTAAHLAWPHTDIDLLALALDRPTWEVELAVLELVEQGALIRRDDGRYEPRAPASALPAWSEMRQAGLHARLAAALPDGEPARLGHLLAGRDVRAIVDEALRRADAVEAEGQRAEGIGLLREALRAVRSEASAADRPADAERRLLRAMARLALGEDGRPQLGAVRAELSRADDPALADVDRLLALAIAAQGPDPATARAEAERMPPFADEAFELARLNLIATAAIYESPAASARALDAMAPWFAERTPALRARFAGWRGNLLYRRGRFEEAAALHLEAAGQRPDPPGRLACLANAALALLEGFEFARAEAIARRLAAEAAARRLPILEAMGERVLRAVAYRTGRATAPDDPLVHAAEGLEHVTLPALIALNEGAVAWRLGRGEAARAHARTAHGRARRSGQRIVMRVADALAMLADPPDPAAAEALAAEVLDAGLCAGVPRVAAQLLGVARRVHPAPPAAWRDAALRFAGAVPAERWSHPLELLSLAEATAP